MSTRQQQRVSRVRQAISTLQGQVDEELGRLMGCRTFVKGSLYRWEHTCGKKNCRCAEGALHEHWVLSYYEKEGKLVKVYLTPEEVGALEKAVEAHREFKKTRARLAKKHAQLLPLINELENALAMPPPNRKKKEKG